MTLFFSGIVANVFTSKEKPEVIITAQTYYCSIFIIAYF